MNKLIFKLFCLRSPFSLFFVFLIVLSGCMQITGNTTREIPTETNKNPEAYFCPETDCSKVFEGKIKKANFSAHCAFYDIELKNIISSLAGKSKTADVKVIIDDANYDGQIKGEGLKMDNERQLMHNKFCVIDGSIVLTGSFNPTDNDNNYNNNNIIVIYSKILAKNYNDEFDELWRGEFGNGNNAVEPKLYLNNIEMENYFCPEDCFLELSSSINTDSGLYKIIDLIRNAEESVKVASFTFTHEAIADELIKAASRRVNVTILTESRQRNVMGSQYQRVKDFGLNIRLDGNKYTMHHKFIVIDGKIVITGSPNFTWSGMNKNDENMLIIHDEGLALKYSKEFNRLYDESEKV